MAATVNCPYTETINNPKPINICANETDGTFLQDSNSDSCQGYILCKNHREVKANCPNELIFNPQSRSCVYPTHYTCSQGGKKTSPACRSLANNTRLANEDHCHKYYVCVSEVLHERECAAHMAYDVGLGRCVSAPNATCYATAKLPPPENTFCLANGTARSGYFADPDSCNHYYVCGKPSATGKHDTHPVHMECDPGKFYDEVKLSCRDRLNVRCTLDRCADSTLTYVNVLGDCQSYARCANGVTVGSGRCPQDYYFDERSQGCTPVNHNYIACAA